MEKKELEHEIYKKVKKEEAEGCAWVFTDSENISKYYYKHPPLKPYELKIRIISTGICMSDLMTGSEKWGKKKFPLCTGHEAAGEIIEIGKEVKNFQINQKIMVGPFRNSCSNCEFCKKGMENYCTNMEFGERKLYGKYFGGHSTHLHINAKFAYKIPKNLDIKKIPPLMCAGITTFLPLKAHAKKGDKVAIIGCGGLGHFGLQWAVKMGCKVDIFSSNHEKDDLIKELGADKVIIWTYGEHLVLQNEYDVVLNTLPCELSGDQFIDFFQVLKPKGKFLQVGLCEKGKFLVLDPVDLVGKGISFIGSDVGGARDYREMLEFVEEHGIESICEVFKWDDFLKAVDKLKNGKPRFRCVIDVDEESKKFNK